MSLVSPTRAAVGVVVFAGIALVGWSTLRSPATPAVTSAAPAPTPLPTVGVVVPAFAARTLAGDSIMIGSAGKTTMLVNVWATWCTSCREEMEDLEAIHREFAPRGVKVIAVSVDAGSEALVRRFVTRTKLTFPVVHDQPGDFQRLFGVNGVPTTYVIAADGRLLWQRVGGVHGDPGAVRAAIASAIQ